MRIRLVVAALSWACLASPTWAQIPASPPAATGTIKPKVATKPVGKATPHSGVVHKVRHVPTISLPKSRAHVKVAVGTAKPVVKPAPKPPTPPRPVVPADIGTVTKMKLPRFASLKSDEVNMRAGPGTKYPVNWVYKRRELPVKIEREFDIWRLVEDMDGVRGWVNQGTLVGKRGFVITGTEDRTIRTDARDDASAVAVLKPGVVGRLRSCEAASDWCEVQVQDYRGWLKRDDFWGTLPGEAVQP